MSEKVIKPTSVILHCSATPDYVVGSKYWDRFGAREIKIWHMRDNGWDDIGYQWVIRRSGVIDKGRDENRLGAHCKGHNDSIGVCLIGTREPNEFQVKSLARLALDIYKRHGIVPDDWYGHNEFADKECPGIPMALVRQLIRLEIDASYILN